MNRRLLPTAFLAFCLLFAVAGVSRAQKLTDTPANPENIEATLKLTVAAAKEYEIRVGDNDKPLELHREPVLKCSNPEVGEVYGNVFVWTRDSRPLVVACLFKWFSPETHMAHEFHSLAEEPLNAKFHGDPVWKTSKAGLSFVDIPKAPAPAANEAQRLLQLKQLAKEFSGTGRYGKNVKDLELRLLPQPIYRYAAAKHGIINGGLFTFVRGTDPEIFLLIEARGKDPATARWQFAAARMNNGAELRLKHKDEQVWEAEKIAWRDIYVQHEEIYTTFRFKEIPGFLKDAIDKPKP
jgi:hypothetical protein